MSTTDLTAARLCRPGPDGARVLLVAGRGWLETGPAEGHGLPVRLLDRLWLSTRRGIELDVVCDLGRVLRLLETFSEAWNVAAYDAVVLLPDLGRAPVSARADRVIERLSRTTRVVGVSDGGIRQQAQQGHAQGDAGWDEVRIDPVPGSSAAALVADAVGEALHGFLAAGPVPESAGARSLSEHLQRIAVLASSAFEVGSAAIAVLSAGRTRTLAAVGPALGEQPCVRAAAMRPMVVLDAWRDTRLARDVRPRGAIRFFAAHPLELADGSAMGALSIFDTEPRTADEFDGDVLRDLAELASAELQYAGAPA